MMDDCRYRDKDNLRVEGVIYHAAMDWWKKKSEDNRNVVIINAYLEHLKKVMGDG